MINNSGIYINVKSNILTKVDDEYQIKHYSFSFLPIQTYGLDKFYNYLNELNRVGLNEEQLKNQLRIIQRPNMNKLEIKQREEERLNNIQIERLRV